MHKATEVVYANSSQQEKKPVKDINPSALTKLTDMQVE